MAIAPELQSLFMLVLTSTLTAAVPTLTYLVIKWVLNKVKIVKTDLSSEQRYLLESVVTEFMRAAEQSGTIGLIEKTGASEKAYVITKTQEWLDAHHLSGIDTQHIGDLIESLVYEGAHKVAAAKQPTLTEILGG